MNIYNSSGFEILVERPEINNPQENDFNKILGQNFQLDISKFEAHSPFYLTEFFIIGYFTYFISFAAVLAHVMVWYGSNILSQINAAINQFDISYGAGDDVHVRMMKKYSDIPEWVYLSWLCCCSLISIFICLWTPYQLPYWATILAIVLGIFLVVPLGIIQAITGNQIGIEFAVSLLIGLLIPGNIVGGFVIINPVATFKSIARTALIQALDLSADLKLGHYMHVNPILC
jgi:hypothetical protein